MNAEINDPNHVNITYRYEEQDDQEFFFFKGNHPKSERMSCLIEKQTVQQLTNLNKRRRIALEMLVNKW